MNVILQYYYICFVDYSSSSYAMNLEKQQAGEGTFVTFGDMIDQLPNPLTVNTGLQSWMVSFTYQ